MIVEEEERRGENGNEGKERKTPQTSDSAVDGYMIWMMMIMMMISSGQEKVNKKIWGERKVRKGRREPLKEERVIVINIKEQFKHSCVFDGAKVGIKKK